MFALTEVFHKALTGLNIMLFPKKMFAGGEDERLHGFGRVEVAQVAAERLEGEGGLP